MATPFKTTLTVSTKTISLDKKAVKELCGLILKAAEDDAQARIYFRLSGGEASVLSSSVDDLMKPQWPANISEILLLVESYSKNRSIMVHISSTVKQIVISATDSEWATIMAGELERFIVNHRNNHWLYQSLPIAVMQASVLLILLLEGIRQLIMPNVDNQYTVIVGILLIVSSISIVTAYIWGVRRLFPIAVVDSGRQSGLATTRKILSWVIPLAMAVLLVNFIWNYFT